MMKKTALLLLFPFLLQHCATKPSATADKGLDAGHFRNSPEVSSLATITIPILRSPYLEKRWGIRTMNVTPDGGYRIHYSKPGNHFESLEIFATPGSIDSDSPKPPDISHYGSIPQDWQTYFIAGCTVHAYIETTGGGDTPSTVSTVTFPVTLPGKPTASYRIIATSNDGENSPAIRSYLTSPSF